MQEVRLSFEIKLFPARESLVSDITAGDGKICNLFLQCIPSIELKFPIVALVGSGTSFTTTVTKVLVPDWGVIADPCIGLSYLPARQQPYARVDYVPQSGTKNLVTTCSSFSAPPL
jgi:hypothetical protein